MAESIIPSEEIWKPVFGYEGLYEISSLGGIRRIATWQTGRKFSTKRTSNGHVRTKIYKGYYQVRLFKGGKPSYFTIHRLVAAAFIGAPPSQERYPINHKDGNKLNNWYENLEYVTFSENTQHALSSGLMKYGERSVHSKLNAQQVREIRKRAANGETTRAIAESYGITGANVSCIRRGKSWKQLT